MLQLNLKNNAASQTTENFNSMCRVGDQYFGTSSTGIYRICGYSDNGVEIPAGFSTPKQDFGTQKKKQPRYLYLGLVSQADLSVEMLIDDVNVGEYTIPSTEGVSKRLRVKLGRGISGRYFTFKFSNTLGSFFAIYDIEFLYIESGNYEVDKPEIGD